MTNDSPSPTTASVNLELLSYIEEYVIVDQPVDKGSGEGAVGATVVSDIEDDDASYDYCEDVFAVSHGNHEEDDKSIASVESLSDDFKGSVVFSVPSGLLKDLDDAHAAAKLARSCAETVSVVAEELDSQEKSASANATDPTSKDNPDDDGKEAKSKSVSSKKGRKAPQESNSVSSSTPVANLSRASNKKRRKKLKLMKKAQAATKAAEILSSRSPPKEIKTKKTDSSSATPTRGGSRKVANIAVACARETMATYRQELIAKTVS